MKEELNLLLPILATIVASVWGFSKFYYLERKQDKEKTSHLILECNLKKIGESAAFKIIELRLNIENKSDTKMYVHADYINLYGVSMASVDLNEQQYITHCCERIDLKKYAYLPRFVELKEKTVVFCGKIFDYDDYWWLDRKEKLEVKRVVYVPMIFDYTEMVGTIYYSINKDWLNVKTTILEQEKGLCHEVTISGTKNNGEKFDWHNKSHLKLHEKYRNAEINNSSLLFMQ